MGSRSSYLYIMSKAAEKAAIGIVRDFGELEKLQISKKGFQNFVTSSDKKAEENIIYILSKAYPNFAFTCEEKGQMFKDTADTTWIIDPIDGTTNFMRGIPYFSINIALCENMEITAGVTLDPIRGEYFKAELGGGAFVNNRNRLRVSGRELLEESVVAVHLPHQEEQKLVDNGVILRKVGAVSLDLAYVAAGKYDACVIKNVMLWDIAVGVLLVREAGGFVRYYKYDSGTFDVIAASSNKLFKKLLSLYNTI